jgi:uncharacterized protein (TIGR02145 family)
MRNILTTLNNSVSSNYQGLNIAFVSCLLSFVFCHMSAKSQTIPPPYINYQAVLYDQSSPIPNDPLDYANIQTFVNINDELGNLLYREEHYASTDGNGLITVKMGDGLYVAGPITNFNQIDWGTGKYYLVVDFNINGTISSTAPEQLVTVPYSFYSGKAGNGMTSVSDNGNGTLTFTYANGSTYTTPTLSGIQGPAGLQGPAGAAGATGPVGPTGQSAYELWLAQGNTGTVQDFLSTSAYQIWLAQGNTGTSQDFLNTLVGPTGPVGATGPAGAPGFLNNGSVPGNTPYWNGTEWVLDGTNFYNNGASLGVGTVSPNASSVLDIESSTKGFLPPRMTLAQRNAIVNPANGLIIFNTTSGCINYYNNGYWKNLCGNTTPPDVTSLNCAGATLNGTLIIGQAANSVTVSVPYTGGNGEQYVLNVNSTGVLGLTASVSSYLAIGTGGTLTYTITGTPATSGTASFLLYVGSSPLSGANCTLTIPVASIPASIATLNCAGATTTGTLSSGSIASGVSTTISYTGGNGGTYATQSVPSTGVLGLTATITGGTLTSNTGNLVFSITGTPTSSGTASFAVVIGGQSCTFTIPVALPLASIATLSCGSALTVGSLIQGTAASGVTSTISYTGGNGGTYTTQTVTSTGVIGLTASRLAGSLATGAGTVLYSITGTPTSSGTASFTISLGGQTCTLTIPVVTALAGQYPAGSIFCVTGPTAIVDVTNPTTGKTWMDRNLGATQTATSSTDVNAYGDLYQWGRRSDGHQCRTSATTTVLSPTDQPSNGNFILVTSIGDWRSTPNNNLWQGNNGINNPCPGGYRLPTQVEFNAEKATWSNTSVSGAFGSTLKLPAAGGRASMIGNNGSILTLGTGGVYWTSTTSNNTSVNLNFGTLDPAFSGSNLARSDGNSVRCIKETVASVGAINCGGAVQTGLVYSGLSVIGVSVSLPYTGGNGGYQLSQEYISTGVNGLNATLSSGIIANGSGNFVLTISGTAANSGVANFVLSIGGQTCTLTVNVVTVTAVISSLSCATANTIGTLNSGLVSSGVITTIPYTGGNGGNYASQVFPSTGVTGLNATITGATLANGSGNLVYSISGTPTSSGTASFAITLGGQSCTFSIPVLNNLVELYPANSVFCASGPTAIMEVTNPVTGKIWMDRNLGASQVATSVSDVNAFGDLYQWGRRSDGHQCRTSTTISTLSGTNQPLHGSFILTDNEDWRNPSNNNLWQGVAGINNPCPTGFRVPTDTEINNERLTWSSNNTFGAYASPLKLTFTGFRNETTGAISGTNNGAYYWTSSALNIDNAKFLSLTSTTATMSEDIRASGRSVRCIKN